MIKGNNLIREQLEFKAVRNTITLLYKLNCVAPNDWSKPLPTGQPNEVRQV
ncbi:hypothetical protein [Leptothoe spongobia]|uniref:Uncharacterized protein n=1 Tax=Leptothoe spongobia TAU-MAC 1115 TaxID=1967444 RepID=A0A947GGS0_9CYAN|nr:hypothetical protein [Leptothoe spongobia]MBT9315055.1 hypothetical protein [Leptothoe spongobia TAU-MAC 1115]